ncbi:MAG TPA: hypothetical protein VGK74_10485 [Symbiobacteriaceae bacterium]
MAVLLVNGRKYLETVMLFLIVLVLPVPVHFAGQISQKATLAKEKEVLAHWGARAAAAVRQETGGAAEVLAENPSGQTSCDKVLVWAGTPGDGTWYWYDVSAGRIVSSATEARVAQLVAGYLRPGDGVGFFALAEGHPQYVTFSFTYPEGRGQGVIHLGGGCRFTLNSVGFRDPPPGIRWHYASSLDL